MEDAEYLDIYPMFHPNLLSSKNLFEEPEFDLMHEDNAEIRDTLMFFVDGSIEAVNKEKIIPYLQDEDVYKWRHNLEKPPARFKMKDSDDFYKYLAIHVSLE